MNVDNTKDGLYLLDNTLATGQALVYKFMANLPKGFHTTIEKEVVKVENLKENESWRCKFLRPEKALSSVACDHTKLKHSSCIHLSEVFKHELSPVPYALFDEYGDIWEREAKP